MKTGLFYVVVLAAIALTCSGAQALVAHVSAAHGLKSSVITFVLTFGFALLGPALLAAAVFLHRKSDSRAPKPERAPASPN